MTLQCVRSRDQILGYGIVLRRGPGSWPQGDDLDTVMALAKEALEEYRLGSSYQGGRIQLCQCLSDTPRTA